MPLPFDYGSARAFVQVAIAIGDHFDSQIVAVADDGSAWLFIHDGAEKAVGEWSPLPDLPRRLPSQNVEPDLPF